MGLELPDVPEFSEWRPYEGAMCHTRRLGVAPKGWRVERVSIALFHRGRVACVGAAGGWREPIRLDRRYSICVDGRYFIGDFPNAESERPWRPEVKWLFDLTDKFEIAATAWCTRGAPRVELFESMDWFFPWPHRWGWLENVTAGGYVFCTKEEVPQQ